MNPGACPPDCASENVPTEETPGVLYRDSPRTEVVYEKEPKSSARVSFSKNESKPPETECCLKEKLSKVKKHLKAYDDLRRCPPIDDADGYNEQELNSVQLNQKSSSKSKKRRPICCTKSTDSATSRDNKPPEGNKEIPKPESESSRAPTYHLSTQDMSSLNDKKCSEGVCKKECPNLKKKSEKVSKPKSLRNLYLSLKKHTTSKTSQTQIEKKSECKIEITEDSVIKCQSQSQVESKPSKSKSKSKVKKEPNLTLQCLPPIEVAPCVAPCKDCTELECDKQMAADVAAPCVCYQNGRSSQSYSTPTYATTNSTPGYGSSSKYHSKPKSSDYYTGTATGTGHTTHSTGGYSGIEYYYGTGRGIKESKPAGDGEGGENGGAQQHHRHVVKPGFACDSRKL